MPDSVDPDDSLTDEIVQSMATDRAHTLRVAREDRWLALREEHEEMIRITDRIRASRALGPVGGVVGAIIKPPKGLDLT